MGEPVDAEGEVLPDSEATDMWTCAEKPEGDGYDFTKYVHDVLNKWRAPTCSVATLACAPTAPLSRPGILHGRRNASTSWRRSSGRRSPSGWRRKSPSNCDGSRRTRAMLQRREST